jgi:aspartyl-tRNA(Asn)/glutamyl-tRNA(Gln) amidotransferase subunit B
MTTTKSEWESVIGLEVHVQLATKAKLFSGASAHYGAKPNSQACAVDLAFPGVLPVLNREVLTMAVRFGLSVNADISKRSIFARKNYFYPDLPKGYQITQFEHPIVGRGTLPVITEDGRNLSIGITRAHLEEDAGKSLHDAFNSMTGVDLNRAGVPLLEIVSEPELRSAAEAVAYLKTLHALVGYLQICDGNLQEGSFRCDANVSVRKKGDPKFGTRAEIKNVNSFRFVEKAIEYEIARQIQVLEQGGTIVQETRLYDSAKNETRSMRSKENANDYRYFPDPDLLPVEVSQAFIDEVATTMPELPWQKRLRLQQEYALSEYDANVLTSNKALCDFFEEALAHTKASAKITANWVMGDLSASLNKNNLDIEQSPISSRALGGLLSQLADNIISGKIAKTVFEKMWSSGEEASVIIEREGLVQENDSAALEKVIDELMLANPSPLAEYRSGKDRLFGYFVGLVMKQTAGKANPAQVNELLKKKLPLCIDNKI